MSKLLSKLNIISNLILFVFFISMTQSCVSNKKYALMESEYQSRIDAKEMVIKKCDETTNEYKARVTDTEKKLNSVQSDYTKLQNTLKLREEQIQDLKDQVADYKAFRDKQVTQVGDLTVLSQSANANIAKTLSQLEQKDKYIQLLQAAKTKADSINLALAINLKSVLKDGIADEDVEIKVDKTVVFINLSDKMLYQSGSSNLTPKANEVLGKIAQIVASRPDLEVMVEGYTDNIPVRNSCMEDNWDLSVKRATSVVRVLQNTYGINPDKLIAAGRGQYNTLASNNTAEGRAINRRTRVIILPKLDQFYDLLNPNNVPN